MKNSQGANAFLRLFKKGHTNESPRAASAVPKPTRATTSYAHLLGAPRAALERMTGQVAASDSTSAAASWEAWAQRNGRGP